MKRLLLICLLGFNFALASTDNEHHNSHVFYPDIVTHIKGITQHQYLKLRIVVLTTDPKVNNVVEQHEALMRDRILDKLNDSDANTFRDKEQFAAFNKEVHQIISSILIREYGLDISTQILIKKIIIE